MEARSGMSELYPATYQDQWGAEQTAIKNDGKTLRMVIRGVEFTGNDFDSWKPAIPYDARLSTFPLHPRFGELCSCTLEWNMRIPIVSGKELLHANLQARLEFGNPSANGGIDREILHLILNVGETQFSSCGKHGYFEDELNEIQSALPEGMYLKGCINCAFSDYSPLGNGLFGSLACFRGNKIAYRAVRHKYDLLAIWDTKTEYVQETYLCPEFERRTPGQGYRG